MAHKILQSLYLKGSPLTKNQLNKLKLFSISEKITREKI